jgi:choline dehydrogenase-like flavoprotein
VSGPTDYPWDPNRSYRYPPAARNASAQNMATGCRALGIRTADAPAAVLTAPRLQHGMPREACIACGTCHQGCRTGAKATMGTTYLPAAIANGAEIRAGAMVHTIETDATGRVRAVVYRQDGVEIRQACRALVLSAGGVETPRLLLANDLANGSGQVGRNFLAHPATQVWGTFDRAAALLPRIPVVTDHRGLPRAAGADFAGGYLIQSLGVMPLTFATSLVRGADSGDRTHGGPRRCAIHHRCRHQR